MKDPNEIAALTAVNDTQPLGVADAYVQSGTSQAPLEQTVSAEFPPLTLEDVESLRAGNTSDDRIREIAAVLEMKRGKQKIAKADLAAILNDRKDWLLEQSGGKPLFSSKIAGMLLIQAGHCGIVRGFNAFGDKLGKHGHNLPSVVIGGTRRYDMTYFGKSTEEKRMRQEYFDRSSRDILRELVAELKEASAN